MPRTPPTKQRWGKGEGGRRNRRWTQRDGASAGLGGTERHPQRERDRDSDGEREIWERSGEQPRAGKQTGTGTGETQRRREARESLTKTDRERDTGRD